MSAWDIIQQRSFDASSSLQASHAERKADKALTSMQSLDSRIDRLSLVNRAMWELIQTKLGLSDKDLLEKVREVDMRDGKLDGKVKGEIRKCPSCQNVLSARHLKCLYCGAPVLEGSAYDSV